MTRPLPRPWRTSNLYFPTIPPVSATFSDNNAQAARNTNINWLSFTNEERGDIIFAIAKTLIDAHDFRYGPDNFRHSPRVLTCKTYNESTFQPQIGNDNSSAVGLTQILDGTSEDFFDRHGRWFWSKVPGFETVRDGANVAQEDSFHHKMAASIPAQIELGLAVLQMKALDATAQGRTITGVKSLLQNYYGSKDSTANANYANKIYTCAKCIKDNNNKITQSCLDCAKGLHSCPIKNI